MKDVRAKVADSRWKEHLRTWRSSLILLPFCVYFALSRGDYTLLDAADLVIHEAGHLIFSPFGSFLRMAGGTLMQLLIPFVIAWSFFRNDYLPGTQAGLLWFGQSLINVSVYAADARIQALPLFGPPGALHDWHYLLSKVGLLEYDTAIGLGFYILALLVFVALLLLPLRMW